MAEIQTINIGSSANDGTGDTIRAGMDKVNDNFANFKIEGTNFTGSILIGHSTTSGFLSSALQNVGVGIGALDALAQGDNNVAVGYNAATAMVNGTENVAIGASAFAGEDAHGKNVAVGFEALKVQDAGADGFNVAVGHQAGLSISTGINNTIIGGGAGDALAAGNNNIIIGKDAAASATDVDNTTVIGNSSTASTRIEGAITNRAYTGAAEGGGFDATDAVSISVGEYNSEIVTTIFVDIGVGSILSSGAAGDVIGNDGVADAYITRLTTAVNGLVYKGEMICLEVPTTGDPDINLVANSSGTIAEDAAGEGEHVLINGGVSTLSQHFVADIPSGGIVDDYIYLTHGGTTAGTYNAGKYLIRFYGAKVTGL